MASGGLFITLEGPDGAGKSSQSALLADRLRARGHDVVQVREPGGTDLGERIRVLLLTEDGQERLPLADALLFNTARHQLVEEVIRPALALGHVVLCDRYADSTLAYQGYGGLVPLDVLRALAGVATGGLKPDLTLLFDIPSEAGLERRAGGPAAELTRFEIGQRHDLEFHRRVRDGYLALAGEETGRWRVLDATEPPEIVALNAWAAISGALPEPALEDRA